MSKTPKNLIKRRTMEEERHRNFEKDMVIYLRKAITKNEKTTYADVLDILEENEKKV